MQARFFFIALFCLSFFQAQTIRKIVAEPIGSTINIEITTSENITYVINSKGDLVSFYTTDFNGLIEYYDNNAEKFRFGKIKSIGNLQVEYWNTAQQNDGRFGKVKNIGKVAFDYWESQNYDRDKFGKLKSIGAIQLDYWDQTASDANKVGRLKSINSLFIDYWEQFNNAKAGKLKSFGNVQLEYWDQQFGNDERFGKPKSINGNTENCLVKVRLF